MSKLAIIIAGVNEWPQVIYTIRAAYEEFYGRADFEIIYVDNFPNGWDKPADKSLEDIKAAAALIPNLKVLEYRDHLSHWACKGLAIRSTDADFFLFLDAHVIPSRDCLYNQYEYYRKHHEEMNGSLHVPLTYRILESRSLQYKMINELDKGWIGYSFAYLRGAGTDPYRVSCHSMCGCMMSRKVYERFGGWPEIMTAWGGGENLFNFVLSIIGMNKWLIPGRPLHHDGSPRAYSVQNLDLLTNRIIAMNMVGGKALVDKYVANQNLNKSHEQRIATIEAAMNNPQVVAQRSHIVSQQVIDIESWAKAWKDER